MLEFIWRSHHTRHCTGWNGNRLSVHLPNLCWQPNSWWQWEGLSENLDCYKQGILGWCTILEDTRLVYRKRATIRGDADIITYLGEIPLFYKKCAISRQLFDLIVEFRVSMTSATIEEHIHRRCWTQQFHCWSAIIFLELHLLTYTRKKVDFILTALSVQRQGRLDTFKIAEFSSPTDSSGYADSWISDEIIKEVYLHFVNSSRKEESDQLCRSYDSEYLMRFKYLSKQEYLLC